MKNPFIFEAEPFELDSEFDEYEEELDFYSEFDSEFGEFDTELADSEWEEERGRRFPVRRTGFRRMPGLRPRPSGRPLRPPRRRPKPPKYPRPSIRPRPRPIAVFPEPVTVFPEPPIVEPEPHQPQGTEYIRWVQSSLNRILGLSLPVDGIMTPETRDAIRRFQERERLPVDGIVGPETERALIAARAGQTTRTSDKQPAEPGDSQPPGPGDTQPAEPGEFDEFDNEFADFEWEEEVNRSSRDYVRWVQSSLNKIMGLRLSVDGSIGTQTRSAIRSFQQRQGLRADGIVGSRTEAALIASGASPPPTDKMPTPILTGRPDMVNVRGIRVARQIAEQVEGLLAAVESDGIRLGGGGYRSPEAQIELRKKHCGTTHYDIYEKPASQCTPPTAPPGKSMHERGLAIDFTYNGLGITSRDNPGFQWLSQNAARFGLKNLPSEPWHWSVDGR